MKSIFKSICVFLIVLMVPCALFAKDYFITYDWSSIQNIPTYVRYQVDGGDWIESDTTGVLLSLDETVDHVVNVSTSYDGVIYGQPSVVNIPKTEAIAEEAELPVVGKEEYSEPTEVAKKAKNINIALSGQIVFSKNYGKSLAGDFSQVFTLGKSRFALGYSVGGFVDLTRAAGKIKINSFGAQLGLQTTFKINTGLHAVLTAGALAALPTKKQLDLNAYASAGLIIVLNDVLALGLKATYVHPIKSFAL